MVKFGPLAAEICWRVWGTPANLNGFRVLAELLHGILVIIIIIIIVNDNVYGAVLMTVVTARVHPVHLMNADWSPGGRQPWDQANRLGLLSPPINGCYHPHPSSPFVIITQPESWYSFYRPMDGGRLSRPRHCKKGAQPVTKTVHRSGCHDKHNWLQPLTPQSVMPSLNHCNLQRHVGVNNLSKVVTRQRRSRKLNSQPASCKSNALATRLLSHLVVGVSQTLRRWTEGATYIRQGGHHVGHWLFTMFSLYDTWNILASFVALLI